MADKKQRLVSSILEFLTDSMEDGSIKQDDKEGIEVAIQCIGEAFGVDVSDEAQKKQLSVKPTTLAQIFDVYLKTEAKRGAAGSSASKAAPAATPAASTAASSGSSSSKEPSAADIAAADKLKGEGNQLMAGKKFAEAIEKYTLAIEKNPSNPVYYSNRAAAHSQAGDHESAIEDAMSAREIDENYTKAYSRMGHAYFSLGRYGEAVTAYEKGVELEPSNASMKASLATARQKAGEGSGSVASPRSPPAAGAGGNPFAGLGGGAGGMPDLASLMSNPQLMQAAQQMMGNGGLESLMQNPMLRQMAERFGQGGGMPDMNTLMSDPTIRQMAEQFGRGAGGGGSSSGNNNNGNNPDMYS